MLSDQGREITFLWEFKIKLYVYLDTTVDVVSTLPLGIGISDSQRYPLKLGLTKLENGIIFHFIYLIKV